MSYWNSFSFLLISIKPSNETRLVRQFKLSHLAGMDPFFRLPSIVFPRPVRPPLGSVPINSFVPTLTVSGLSVESRKVIHGAPKTVVSSVIPPESVITALEFLLNN